MCDPRGVFKEGMNLTETERAGLDEIKEGIRNKDWMIYTSDKSGKVVLDTKENFLKCMKEHYEGDQVVTPDQLRKAEKNINDHAKAWRRILSVGESSGHGQVRRCSRAMVSKWTTVPTLQGLRKDH